MALSADTVKLLVAAAWWSFAWSFVWSGVVFYVGFNFGRENPRGK